MAKSKSTPKEKSTPTPSNGTETIVAEVVQPIEEQEDIIIPVKDQLLALLSSDIARFDKYGARIAEIKEKCAGLVIKDIDDKEGYENVRLAISYCRKIRTGTLADKKVSKAPLIAAGKSIEDRSNWIITQVTAIEEPLQARKDEIDAEKEKALELKRQAKAAKLSTRLRQLREFGAQDDGTVIYLGEISYKMDFIRDLDDDVYDEKIVPKFKEVFEANETVRLEAEQKIRDEQKKLDDERKELDRQRLELDQQRQKLAQDQLDEQKRKDDALAEERRLKAETEKNLFRSRLSELKNVGWNGQYVFMLKADENSLATYADLISWDAVRWNNFRDLHNQNAEDVLAKAKIDEDKRLEKIRQDAIEADRKIQDAKREQDAKDKKEREERELEEASDKKKWEVVYEHLRSCPLPEMKGSVMIKRMNKVKDFLASL